MASNALQKRTEKLSNARALLQKLKPQVALALPRNMDPDRVVRIATTALQRDPNLLHCDHTSLAGAIVQCAQLGLEPDSVSGQAALIPYKGKVQLIPMYKGLIKLARNSGEIGPITAEVVYEGDDYEVELGAYPKLRHMPSPEKQKESDIVAFYAVAQFLEHDRTQFVWLWKWEVDEVRGKSPAGSKKGTPWTTHYVEMGKKTALRRLCKLLPSSAELQRAVGLDELAEIGMDQDLEAVIDISAEESNGDEEKPSSLDEIADKEKAKKSEANGQGKLVE